MSLFNKKPSTNEESAQHKPADPRKKSGPTPTRKQQEALHFQGIKGGDKKLAKQRLRAERQRQIDREQEGLRTGREDLLPLQHRGAARRFIRNYVDQRYCVSEWMILVVLILMFGGLITVSFLSRTDEILALQVNTWSMILSYAALIGGSLEAIVIAVTAKKQALQRFSDAPRGLAWYAFARAVMPRRMRQPRPLVPRSKKTPPTDPKV